MKKTSLASRNALLSPGGFSWGIGIFVIVVFLALVRLILPNIFLTITAPVMEISQSFASGIYSLTNGFRSTAALAQANDSLLNQNAALSAENRTLSERLADLTSLLQNQNPVNSGIVGGVIARPPESFYDSFILSVGTDDGVAEGMEAFGAGGIPLGVVSSVTANFSRVTLFSSSGAQEDAWVGTTRTPTTLIGAGGDSFTAQIPRTASTSVGDAVYLPGPGAIPIGTVGQIVGNPSDPAVTLLIQPALNIYATTWVLLRDNGSVLKEASSTLVAP